MGNMTSSSASWSIEEYCATQQQASASDDDWSTTSLPASTQAWLQALGLPVVHPFCTEFSNHWEEYYGLDGVPRQGPLLVDVHENVVENAVTMFTMVAPALLAMGELWLRLLASLLASLGMIVMVQMAYWPKSAAATSDDDDDDDNFDVVSYAVVRQHLDKICILTTAASVVLLTDTLYVLEFGPLFGAVCLMVSTVLAGSVCRRFVLNWKTQFAIVALWAVAGHLITTRNGDGWTFGDAADTIDPTLARDGLYYSKSNSFVHKLVQAWQPAASYQYHDDATPWMPTGDARTGLPFLLHHVALPDYHRVWLPVDNGTEAVALDIAFPKQGYNATLPTYLVLHGLNGGSAEEYVRDFVWRQTNAGATVVVMVARGLMDTPVRGWNIFHGARWTDAAAAAVTLKRVMQPHQALVGVGYSMGAIVLSNMVVQAGRDCALDAAVAISGGLDMRQQEHFRRAQRLWQPILCKELRQTFLLGKWGERVRARLSHDTLLRMMRATHITGIDASAVVEYNGFRHVVDYYEHMSALGDVPLDELMPVNAQIARSRKIHQLSIPLLVVQALDDPLITWRTVASNAGPMHPSNLTKTGQGNLMILLTKRGGHVGWPLGWLPQLHTWHWMNQIPASLAASVQEVKQQQKMMQATGQADS